MEVGNIAKPATFKTFIHLSYKNTLLIFCDGAFNISNEKNINQLFWGVTQKYEMYVFFNLILLIEPFSYMTKKLRQKVKYLENEKLLR